MYKNKKKAISMRIISVMMAVMIGVTFMPLAIEGVRAKTDKAKNVKTGKDISKVIGTTSDGKSETYTVSAPNANGIVSIQGNLNNIDIFKDTGAYFSYLYVDGSYVRSIGNSVMNIMLDMKEYSVGYHTITIQIQLSNPLYNKNTGNAVYTVNDAQLFVPTYFYNAPNNVANRYDVYNKKMFYNNSDNYYQYDSSCVAYMEHRIKRKKKYGAWKNDGYMDSSTNYQFPGLKPNKKFQTRLRYSKTFAYNGTDYTWYSGYSGVQKMKAGTNKMKVKSIKVQAYNVKRHPKKFIYKHWTSLWTYVWRSKTVGYYYTYKIRAVVKLKKKPGAKGIMINKYRLKGNKKVYVKKLGSRVTDKKPSKSRYYIYLTSYQNKTYGGWSPQIKKKCKIR